MAGPVQTICGIIAGNIQTLTRAFLHLFSHLFQLSLLFPLLLTGIFVTFRQAKKPFWHD